MIDRFSYLIKIIYMLSKYSIFLIIGAMLTSFDAIADNDIFAVVGICIGALIIMSIGEWVVLGKLIWNFNKPVGKK